MPQRGLEPPRPKGTGPQPAAYANSATEAFTMRIIPKAGELSNGGTHPGAFQNGGENFRHSYRAKDEIDFWRRDEVPPPKINFLLRPVGVPEIFAPILKCARVRSAI